jgi:hypothetical protein
MLSSVGAVSWVPIRKCPGVREVKSWGTFDRGMIGREFKQASIIARSVYSPTETLVEFGFGCKFMLVT